MAVILWGVLGYTHFIDPTDKHSSNLLRALAALLKEAHSSLLTTFCHHVL